MKPKGDLFIEARRAMREDGVHFSSLILLYSIAVWYTGVMTIKEIAIGAIEKLPDTATWVEVQERINFVAGVRHGLCELDEGKGIPHERVKEEFAEWLTE